MLLAPISIAMLTNAAVFGLIALTLLVVRRGMCPKVRTGGKFALIRTIEVFRWIFVVLFILAIVGAMVPLYIAAFFSAIIIFMQFQSHFSSRNRELRSLGLLLVTTYQRGGSLPDLLEAYGRSNPTIVGAKSMLSADAVRRGQHLLQACDQYRLRLPTTSRLLMAADRSAQRIDDPSIQGMVDDPMLVSKLATLTVYIPILILTMVTVLTFFGVAIFPTFEEMFEEFELHNTAGMRILRLSMTVASSLALFLAFAVIYLVIITLIWLAGFEGALRGVPIFGSVILQKRRALALDALALATKRGSSLPDAFRELRLAAANVGERRIYHACVTDMENGSPMSTSLNRILSAQQSAWVGAAEKSNHLPDALGRLAELIRLRARRTIELNVAVLVPLVTCLFAIPVAMICYGVILALVELILWLT
jgi:hypothetical protein